MTKHINESNSLVNLCINDQRLDPRSWKKLGQAIAKSTTIQTLQISACNLAITLCIKNLCHGLRENDNIKYLDLSCNELNDEQGKLIVDAVKLMAEKRDHLQWIEGLRCEHSAFNAHIHDHHPDQDGLGPQAEKEHSSPPRRKKD